jgi:hypothetical protein
MIDIGRALQHPFQDQNWLSKLGIGALINLVPVLNFAGTGYMVEHTNNVKKGPDVPLPTWDTLGALFMLGLKLVVVFFIYLLPIFALSCVLGFATAGLATVASTVESSESASSAAGAGIGVISLALSCLSILYAVFFVYLYPAIFIQFARTRDIAACLRVGEVFAIARKNSADYILIFLVLIGISLALSIIASILAITVVGLCLLLPLSLVATPYINVVIAHLCGQYDRAIDPVTTPRPDFVPPA